MDGTTIFRKTERGVAELAQRSGRLSLRARSTLIVINGRTPLVQLLDHLGLGVEAALQELLRAGLIEPLPGSGPGGRVKPSSAGTATPGTAPAASAGTSSSAAVTPAVSAAAYPAVRAEGPLVDLMPIKRRTWALLGPYFGPDVEVVCRPLMAARTQAELLAALDGIEQKLAIYLGRRAAAAALAPLRRPAAS